MLILEKTMVMPKFNIALTFDNSINTLIVNYAQKIYSTITSDFILGVNAYPHLTIGQFDLSYKEASRIWGSYKSIVKETPELNFSGVNVFPASEGDTWLEISVVKNKTLVDLQERLTEILQPYTKLTSETKDDYRPHITIAHWFANADFINVLINDDIVHLKCVKTKINIGKGLNFNSIENYLLI